TVAFLRQKLDSTGFRQRSEMARTSPLLNRHPRASDLPRFVPHNSAVLALLEQPHASTRAFHMRRFCISPLEAFSQPILPLQRNCGRALLDTLPPARFWLN